MSIYYLVEIDKTSLKIIEIYKTTTDQPYKEAISYFQVNYDLKKNNYHLLLKLNDNELY